MMIQKQLFATFALLTAAAGAADVEIDPLTTRWTFGAHEPYTMYRRVGKHCVFSDARWERFKGIRESEG